MCIAINVVHLIGRHHTPSIVAESAQRKLGKVHTPQLAPSVVIATLGTVAAGLIV
jgi:hypothetical protein